ncbi:unnamed protein product [Didymodactylos carnosus]|uniref:Limiting CO2-inducible protein B/C beta carbonyic anhydrase domain-containing protein n=1 Tax=Didymodactylos carnosus TaxID=1234261 RepID=A0A813WDN4_9BILA|nr:unnamed protein product [Didymodactylos carnosus]CAF1084852.1 unnamed protein product [Didymodactylos carnosus]CAF3639525.1 unnamed protein product [Didymodactylos carnosus]CAF3847458.1 unnamed protein product [Didymodactylos carnosus]
MSSRDCYDDRHRSSPKRESLHKKSSQHSKKASVLCSQCGGKVDENSPEQTAFKQALEINYPYAMSIEDFVFKTKELLIPYGFLPNVNTMCLLSLCRDEITSPFKSVIESIYGASFSCGSLGGMLLCGRTGFAAAHHHVPADGANLIYYCFTHIGINSKGQVGSVLRSKTAMKEESTACGALVAFNTELKKGLLSPVQIDEDDLEMSMLKKQILKAVPTLSTNSTLWDVTNAAYLAITIELENHVIQDSKHHNKRRYALFTGIQIHGPKGHDFAWIGKSSLIHNGILKNFPLS